MKATNDDIPEKCKDCLYKDNDTLFCAVNRLKYAWSDFKKAFSKKAKSHDCDWYENKNKMERTWVELAANNICDHCGEATDNIKEIEIRVGGYTDTAHLCTACIGKLMHINEAFIDGEDFVRDEERR